MNSFKISIEEKALEDLKTRLHSTRWPDGIFEEGDADGFCLSSQHNLIRYWTDVFDWRAQEARLNALPQQTVTIDGLRVHLIHARGHGPSPLPLVLTHGWPGSFLEFERIIPLLTDPGRHGGDPGDAFDVVIPSLPGFGFSAAPVGPGVSTRKIADMWASLMTSLGYDRFAAQGGDIGAGVSMWLARRHPRRMIGVHLNYIPGSYRPAIDPQESPLSADEQAFLNRSMQFAALEGAYAQLQSTKPQTLGYGLSDSPAGLAAWIAEKFYSWSDRRERPDPISLDVLLTNISIYWFTNTLVSSFRIYKENRLDPLHFGSGERVAVPFGFAAFPCELPTPPQSWVERVFSVNRWTDMPRGGHFAALEQPKLLADEIRAFFRPLRPQ
ncbi:MAG: epoxide hydrolase [Azospirillaceae bacterium]|nr:epoxide hydrolase [Azospirillaceae bacterium]